MTPTPLYIRFWRHVGVAHPDQCWNWLGRTDRHGYGRINCTGKPRTRFAHRVAYELRNGPIPDALTVDHLCFNTVCVNPRHLRLLTARENSANQRPRGKRAAILAQAERGAA